MERKLQDILDGKSANYIFPFFWQHGDAERQLIDEIEAIHQSGVAAMCVESRTHENFCQESWWQDFGLILREAKKRKMQVWLLDDKHFPTGYANGLIGRKYPERRKWHLIEHHVDVIGPQKGALLLSSSLAPRDAERTLFRVLACRRSGKEETLEPESLDLTDRVHGDFLYWEVPDGCYRIFVLYRSREGSSLKDYIHMIDPLSVDTLIEAVYEPHYAHYREEFGRTFAGFFSDEPCFGNRVVDSFGWQPGFYDQKIGTPYLALPWTDDMSALLAAELGYDATPLLPGLWFPMGEKTSCIRLAYMNVVTRRYRDSFSNRLGKWCRDHGVRYIGHVIEDMNCSSHMGCGAGHYFRSLDGQDMAGIDVVLQQVIPGMGGYIHTAQCYGGKTDPVFFHYVLAKLAASLANAQPRMHGDAFCEIYGAYGWAEGLPMMKWLTDFMLVRGINHFVPHAFSPKFPDADCPPHFYAHGQNPQYRDFRVLMEYANRMCHLFSGGTHVANAAVLYHAEAEWSGGGFMPTQVPAKLLYDAQIDYDILPIDSVIAAHLDDSGKLIVNQEKFDCLIVPYAEILPFVSIRKLSELADRGLCVIFLDGFPRKSAENRLVETPNKKWICVPPERLVEVMHRHGFYDIRLRFPEPFLRCFHYRRQRTDFYMLFNESMHAVSNQAILPVSGAYGFLDLMQGIWRHRTTRTGEIPIELQPYQSCVLVFSDGDAENLRRSAEEPKAVSRREISVEGPYRIEVSERSEHPRFEIFRENAALTDITGPDGNPRFSGIIRYTVDVRLASTALCFLDLGTVGETVRIFVNGRLAGIRICPPYRTDVTEWIRAGSNTFVFEVANSMAYRMRDPASCGLMTAPSGILGPVVLTEFEGAEKETVPAG